MQIEDHWLDQASMAEACGVSLSAFQKWRVQPVARVGRKVYYEAMAVIENRVEHARRQHERLSERATAPEAEQAQREARCVLMRAQAEGQELKNARLRQTLAPVDLLAWVLEQAGAQICAFLEGIPASVKRSVPRLTAADLAIVKREIAKAQKAAVQMSVDLDEYESQATD